MLGKEVRGEKENQLVKRDIFKLVHEISVPEFWSSEINFIAADLKAWGEKKHDVEAK